MVGIVPFWRDGRPLANEEFKTFEASNDQPTPFTPFTPFSDNKLRKRQGLGLAQLPTG